MTKLAKRKTEILCALKETGSASMSENENENESESESENCVGNLNCPICAPCSPLFFLLQREPFFCFRRWC